MSDVEAVHDFLVLGDKLYFVQENVKRFPRLQARQYLLMQLHWVKQELEFEFLKINAYYLVLGNASSNQAVDVHFKNGRLARPPKPG